MNNQEDNLHGHISSRRDDFELYNTDFDAAWEQIDHGVAIHNRKARLTFFLRVAATLLVLIVVGLWGIEYKGSKEGYALHDVSSELAETEHYYTQQVADKMRLIKANSAALEADMLDELQSLDEAYLMLKRDLKEGADSEEVINAMITNYRTKLQLLERILRQIEKHHQTDRSNEANI